MKIWQYCLQLKEIKYKKNPKKTKNKLHQIKQTLVRFVQIWCFDQEETLGGNWFMLHLIYCQTSRRTQITEQNVVYNFIPSLENIKASHWENKSPLKSAENGKQELRQCLSLQTFVKHETVQIHEVDQLQQNLTMNHRKGLYKISVIS